MYIFSLKINKNLINHHTFLNNVYKLNKIIIMLVPNNLILIMFYQHLLQTISFIIHMDLHHLLKTFSINLKLQKHY